MVEQRAHILGHDRAVIGGRVVQLAGRAVTAIIERDRATPGASECRYPAGHHPIDLLIGGEAMHEHNRLALPFIQEGDVDPLMLKSWHARTIRSRWQGAKLQTKSPRAGDVGLGSG